MFMKLYVDTFDKNICCVWPSPWQRNFRVFSWLCVFPLLLAMSGISKSTVLKGTHK